MPGYQRFRLIDGTFVWATSEQEARTRWGDQLDGPEVWDVYLVGHGYSLKNYHRVEDNAPNPPQGILRVPHGIYVLFYCDAPGLFDSNWEDGVVGGNPNTGFGPKSVPPGNPKNEAEHILVWPSLSTGFAIRDMVQMLKGGVDPNTGPVQLQRDLRNRCGLYIGRPRPFGHPDVGGTLAQANWAYLSSILTAIATAHTPTRVHWCACRYDYPGNALFFSQATNPFGIESGVDPRYEHTD
jgi:hypothetical protein